MMRNPSLTRLKTLLLCITQFDSLECLFRQYVEMVDLRSGGFKSTP
jgi:hypothetical protein